MGLDTDAGRQRWDDRLAVFVGVVMTAIILLTAAGAFVMLLHLYWGGHIRQNSNPFVALFASRLMVAAARLAILFVGIFIVLSILMHMRRGQWLTAAGPFKVQGAARRLAADYTQRNAQLRVSRMENERLKARVSDLTREVRTLEQLLQQAQTQLRRTPPG